MKQIFTAVMVWVRNDPHGLLHLNTWSLDCGTVWKDCGPLGWMCGLTCYGSSFSMQLWCAWLARTSIACTYTKTFPSGLGLKMWAEGKLSHLSCFCQMICHNEKSNNYFSHLDTGKHAAPSCCALWLGEMVGHFPTSEYDWSFLLQSRRTGGSHAVQT